MAIHRNIWIAAGYTLAAVIFVPYVGSEILTEIMLSDDHSTIYRNGPSYTPGERNWTSRPNGTSNPMKHFRQNPKTGRWEQRDANGK